jgi:hypothetical protein
MMRLVTLASGAWLLACGYAAFVRYQKRSKRFQKLLDQYKQSMLPPVSRLLCIKNDILQEVTADAHSVTQHLQQWVAVPDDEGPPQARRQQPAAAANLRDATADWVGSAGAACALQSSGCTRAHPLQQA